MKATLNTKTEKTNFINSDAWAAFNKLITDKELYKTFKSYEKEHILPESPTSKDFERAAKDALLIMVKTDLI